MNYPSKTQVESASLYQLVNWWRHLPSPAEWAIGRPDFDRVLDEEAKLMERIGARIKELGGITPGISKAVGWDRRSSGGVCMNKIAADILAVAKELVSMDFPSQDALDKYLKDHPGANRSNHKVVKKTPATKTMAPKTENDDAPQTGPNKPVVKNYVNRRREIFQKDSGISHEEYVKIEKKLDEAANKDESLESLSDSAWKGGFKDSEDNLLAAAKKLVKDGHLTRDEVNHVLNRGLSEAKAGVESWTKGSGLKNVSDYPEMTDSQREEQKKREQSKVDDWTKLIKKFRESKED